MYIKSYACAMYRIKDFSTYFSLVFWSFSLKVVKVWCSSKFCDKSASRHDTHFIALILFTKYPQTYHSPGRLYTITCRSDLYRQNLDSWKAKTLRQSCSTQLTCSNAKFKRAFRRAAVNLDTVAGLLGSI
jgi:hypothetical protein